MRGNLETIVGAMFAGKTSELLKRILWAKHQNKKIIVIKPSLDDRYSNEKIITHNDLSHECYSMNDWPTTLKKFNFEKSEVDMVFLDEIQFMDTKDTLNNVEIIEANKNCIEIKVVCRTRNGWGLACCRENGSISSSHRVYLTMFVRSVGSVPKSGPVRIGLTIFFVDAKILMSRKFLKNKYGTARSISSKNRQHRSYPRDF